MPVLDRTSDLNEDLVLGLGKPHYLSHSQES